MKKFFLFLFVICFSPLLWGQIQVTAQVDKTNLTLDDELTLTILVRGGTNVRPQLPSLPAFNVYSQLQSSSYINGQTQHEFRYVMMPRMVGNATIGAITVDYQGKTYRTDPIDVHIYRDGNRNNQPAIQTAKQPATTNYDSSFPAIESDADTLPPLERSLINQANQHGRKEPFFLIAAVSNPRPYVGQTFTLAVRFYYSQQFSSAAPYQAPQVSNLFMEDSGKSEGTQNIGGNLFRYHEMRYQLTGAAPGEAVIGPAHLELGASAFDWFDRFFGGNSTVTEPRSFESAPIRLQIQALPAGKPSSFYGAVGAGFALAATTDRSTVEAGDSVNLSLTVTGPASLKASKDFSFPEINGFKNYPVASTLKTGKRTSKIFKTVLVANASGVYTIPPLEWSYFDPATTQYKTLQSTPITLTVKPSSTRSRSVDFAAQLTAGSGFQSLGTDINYLKPIPGPQQTLLARLGHLPRVNWAFVALLLTGLFMRVGRKQDRAKQAYTQAKKLLHRATSYEQIAEALSHYLSQRHNIQTGSLPIKDIVSALHQCGCTPAQTQPFALLWKQLETLRFAPADSTSSSVQQQANKALELLQILEGKAK